MTTGVLFDLDDTLFDHRGGTRAALGTLRGAYPALAAWPADDLARRHAELLEHYHLDVLAGRLSVDDARLARFRALFTEAGAPLPDEAVGAVAVQYRDAYMAARRAVPGALALLRALRPLARIAIVTNNIVSEQTRKIDELGLAPLIDAAVISEAEGVSKPDPRIFAAALSRIGCDAASSVMVGDAWGTDIVGARATGLRAVWFNPTRRARPDDADGVAELTAFEPTGDAVAVILGPHDTRRP